MGDQGGFPPTDNSGSQPTPEEGWGGGQPTQPTPTGGWGAQGESPTPDSGWGSAGEHPTPAGGWGASPDQPTPDSGWGGAQPTQPTPASPFGAPGLGAPQAGGAPIGGEPATAPKKKKGGIGGLITGKPMLAIVMLLVGAGIMFAVVHFGFIKIGVTQNAKGPQITVGNEQLRKQVETFRKQVNDYEAVVGPIEEARRKAAELQERQKADGTIDAVRQAVRDMDEKQQKYKELQAYLDDINDAITTANADLVKTKSELEVATARDKGLKSDVEKLESLVGKLEDANNRRLAVKESLESCLDLLVVRIKESSPLTPPQYKKEDRIKAAESLQQELASTNWAYPELITKFTDLFLKEIKLNSQQHYFLAKLPLDINGHASEQWCECLSLGTWSVYFQTIDQKNVGVYFNAGEDGKKEYKFMTDLSREEAEQVRAQITRLRPADYAAKIAQLPGAPRHVVRQEHGTAGFFDLL